jgi:hypothetical protein
MYVEFLILKAINQHSECLTQIAYRQKFKFTFIRTVPILFKDLPIFEPTLHYQLLALTADAIPSAQLHVRGTAFETLNI